jgi:hypothetical protein
VAVVLGLLAVGLGGMWVYSSVRFMVTGEVPVGSALVEPDSLVHLGIALDLALLVPAYALAAVLLWRGSAAGFVLASVVLVAGTLHQVSYLMALPFQAAADIPGAVAFDPLEPVIAVLYAVAAAALLAGAGLRQEDNVSRATLPDRDQAVRSGPAISTKPAGSTALQLLQDRDGGVPVTPRRQWRP